MVKFKCYFGEGIDYFLDLLKSMDELDRRFWLRSLDVLSYIRSSECYLSELEETSDDIIWCDFIMIWGSS